MLEALADAGLADESAARRSRCASSACPPTSFVDHGAVADLRRTLQLDIDGIARQVDEALTELGLKPGALLAADEVARSA